MLLVCAFASQAVTRTALARLTAEQRTRVLEVLASAWRFWWLGLLLVVAGVLMPSVVPGAAWRSLVATVAMLGFFVAVQALLARRLGTIDLPPDFVRRMWLAWGLLDLGALGFFGGNTYLAFAAA
jgi:hypothetical protein